MYTQRKARATLSPQNDDKFPRYRYHTRKTKQVTLTDSLEVGVRLAPEAVADGEDLDLVAGPRVEILEDDVRLGGEGRRALARVVAIVGHLEFLLPRVNVALPRDVQALLDRLEILDYRTRGLGHLVEDCLVRLDLVADRLDDYGVVAARQQSLQRYLRVTRENWGFA